MYIPEEYWLDGENDCMNWTDKVDVSYRSKDACLGVPSFIYDEHFCPYNQWSCGNGKLSFLFDIK
jgi:hypothetical protein